MLPCASSSADTCIGRHHVFYNETLHVAGHDIEPIKEEKKKSLVLKVNKDDNWTIPYSDHEIYVGSVAARGKKSAILTMRRASRGPNKETRSVFCCNVYVYLSTAASD